MGGCFELELSLDGQLAPCRDDSEDSHLRRLRPIIQARARSGDESCCPDGPQA